MTNTQRRPCPEVAAAAARAAIELREYDGREVPDWLYAVAAGGPGMTNTEKRPRPEVAAAAARAAIEIREYDGREVPDWLRAVAAGEDVTPPTD
ncbi:hypothetical protein ACFUEJ_10645 [Gordonia sp. NPDC057258]|uniref:hypothetical protein n=1 Tax=unclassified Gordonia (in: high G+C Gram-positive bacteria) TaxID=2657482 RepID=UPI000857CEAC|nr:hypothetical protein A8M60_10695 [Nocardia farcinica]